MIIIKPVKDVLHPLNSNGTTPMVAKYHTTRRYISIFDILYYLCLLTQYYNPRTAAE